MQDNPATGSGLPAQQQRALDTGDERNIDPRPLGGKDTPHEHPFPKKSMDPRPLGAGRSVPEENGEGEEERGTEQEDDTAAAAVPAHDEVDASPEEQFTRHHVELDPEKLHHIQHHKEGPLEQVKKKATDVVRAARAAVEHHLPSSLTTNGDGHNADTPPSPSPQSNITLQNLKYNNKSEPMAKVAEGSNRVVDTDDSSRKFGMSPASASSSVQTGGGDGSGGKDDEDFPETLQEAIKDGAHLSEGEKKIESSRGEDEEDMGEDLNEPEPFGVTSSARSKL